MNQDQLAHLLRAAADIAGDGHILVIGSQAVLATHPEHQLPPLVTMSVEADLTFLDGDIAKSDKVDGAIGEGSHFHQTFGYYPQGVGLDTAVLPAGWAERTVRFTAGDTGSAQAVCLEIHDLVISKLFAGREKDYEYAEALITAHLVDVAVLNERAQTCDVPPAQTRRVVRFLQR